MRNKHRAVLLSAAGTEDAQYCMLCEAVMLFERIDAADHPADDLTDEWICVSCGSAVLVGNPPLPLEHTA
jgi:hypothetical protein